MATPAIAPAHGTGNEAKDIACDMYTCPRCTVQNPLVNTTTGLLSCQVCDTLVFVCASCRYVNDPSKPPLFCKMCGTSQPDDTTAAIGTEAKRTLNSTNNGASSSSSSSGPTATIQTQFVDTKYGRVFVRSIGPSSGGHLMLIVHGSGPRSSSADYVPFLSEMAFIGVGNAAPASPTSSSPLPLSMSSLHIAAMDCPGYGQSTGSRQAIRSYPLPLITQVINGLGHLKALALSGMSQGGASVFNAALENPAICDYLIQDRPVCMNIPSLSRLRQPTLLAFDTEDDGHPIKLGRRMAGQIPLCRFLSWTNSTQPFWWTDNFIQEVLRFLLHTDHKTLRKSATSTAAAPKRTVGRSPTRFKPSATFGSPTGAANRPPVPARPKATAAPKRTAGAARSPTATATATAAASTNGATVEPEVKSGASQPIIPTEGDDDENIIHDDEDDGNGEGDCDDPDINDDDSDLGDDSVIMMETPSVSSLHGASSITSPIDELIASLTAGTRFTASPAPIAAPVTGSTAPAAVTAPVTPVTAPPTVETKTPIVVQSAEEASTPTPPPGANPPEADLDCVLCLQFVWQPIRTPCNHFYCYGCINEAVLHNPSCPLCRHDLNGWKPALKNEDKELVQLVQRIIPASAIQARLKSMGDDAKEKAKFVNLRLEYGNTCEKLSSTGPKPRYKWKLFVRISKSPQWAALRRAPALADFVERVEFDINPGLSKPIRVLKAPFELERSGTYEFGCPMIVVWKAKWNRPPTTLTHTMTLGPRTKYSRFALEQFKAALFA